MAEVSVLIPNRNYGEFIGQCIESVLNQTYKDYEIIVTDDNSTDNSVEIIKKYPVRLIESKENNLGATKCINCCLREAKGKYIAILESDDFWEPNFLEVMVGRIKSLKNVGGIYCNSQVFGQSNWVKYYPGAQDKETLHKISLGRDNSGMPVCIIGTGVSLIYKKVFDDIGEFNEDIIHGHETEWGIRATKYYYFHHIQDLLYNHRIHLNNFGSVYRDNPEVAYEFAKKIKEEAIKWLNKRENIN